MRWIAAILLLLCLSAGCRTPQSATSKASTDPNLQTEIQDLANSQVQVSSELTTKIAQLTEQISGVKAAQAD